MPMPAPVLRAGAVSALLLLAACQKAGDTATTVSADAPAPPADAAPAPGPTSADITGTGWPASLRPFGDGFPEPGDPCRRIGETEATNEFLDHTQVLVGCHSADEAAKLGGTVVATIDGITLVNLPR